MSLPNPLNLIKSPNFEDRSHKRQRGMTLGYWMTKFVCGLFFRARFKTRIVGVKNLPKRGAFILASNHVSYFDPPLISGITPRPLHFFARKSLLKNWWLGLIYRDLNIIPVSTAGGDVAALKKAIAIVKQDKPLVVFPEGTRSEDGQLKRGQAGTGFIACKTGVPVLPVRVFGTYEALPRSTHKPRWGMPLTVVIGAPISLEQYDPGPSDKDRYQTCVDRIMAAVAAIEKPQAHTDSEAEWMM